jgi:hypothetical protein
MHAHCSICVYDNAYLCYVYFMFIWKVKLYAMKEEVAVTKELNILTLRAWALFNLYI